MDDEAAEHDVGVALVDLLSSLLVVVFGVMLSSSLLLLLAAAWMGLGLAQLRLGLRARQF